LKALALRTLAELPLRPPHDGAPRLPSSTTLRDALALLIAERRETLNVTDDGGEAIGGVALEDLLR
jgi:CBS domain containing-hemolysin-like protein